MALFLRITIRKFRVKRIDIINYFKIFEYEKHFTSVFSAILGGAIALGGYHLLSKKKEDNSFSFSSQKTDTTGAIHTNFQQVDQFQF